MRYDGGTTDVAQGIYESAPVEGPYLVFPGGRTYRFLHGLGSAPRSYSAFFAFDEYPYSADSPSGTVVGAGSQATFEAVTDTYVDVRNDTCSEVRIRIVASHPVGTGDGGP